MQFNSTLRYLIFLFIGFITNSYAIHDGQIGVLQYNVKASSAVWTNPALRDKQLKLIETQIKAAPNKVDFIALEEANAEFGIPGPLLSTVLTDKKMMGWQTIVSVCGTDSTQLTYNAQNWTLIKALANGQRPQVCWAKGNALIALIRPHSNPYGRPYNMAYFQSRQQPHLKVLVIPTHMPHWKPGYIKSQQWMLTAFRLRATAVTGVSNLHPVNMIFVGDMNELGANDKITTRVLDPIFGKSSLSPPQSSCCYNDDFQYATDRVATNISTTMTSALLSPAGGYPINKSSGFLRSNEEHKAVFVTLTLPTQKH
ncbi:MAG: hypothetical protein COB66_00860 [Coxiella sp. (in: Bacteria)]|nr:MAG: hypothetical protein COB66_00860 [Coxiella sp. (in: g-proteobacteria)]